jgi:hypothetical protein
VQNHNALDDSRYLKKCATYMSHNFCRRMKNNSMVTMRCMGNKVLKLTFDIFLTFYDHNTFCRKHSYAFFPQRAGSERIMQMSWLNIPLISLLSFSESRLKRNWFRVNFILGGLQYTLLGEFDFCICISSSLLEAEIKRPSDF